MEPALAKLHKLCKRRWTSSVWRYIHIYPHKRKRCPALLAGREGKMPKCASWALPWNFRGDPSHTPRRSEVLSSDHNRLRMWFEGSQGST